MSSNNPPVRRDLSPAMVLALLSFVDGRPWHHLYGRSMHGGATGTVHALARKGLMNPHGTSLTENGWMEARALAARRKARYLPSSERRQDDNRDLATREDECEAVTN